MRPSYGVSGQNLSRFECWTKFSRSPRCRDEDWSYFIKPERCFSANILIQRSRSQFFRGLMVFNSVSSCTCRHVSFLSSKLTDRVTMSQPFRKTVLYIYVSHSIIFEMQGLSRTVKLLESFRKARTTSINNQPMCWR